jgi:hypothetical protein
VVEPAPAVPTAGWPALVDDEPLEPLGATPSLLKQELNGNTNIAPTRARLKP